MRIPNMAGVDIALFDYDRHNALYYFIMNADEHIYMRYGGRDATSPGAYLNLDSIEVALKLGLEQHELYKQGKLEKQERPEPFFPEDIRMLKNQVRGRGRCVECHLIADYRTQELELRGRLDKLEDMFVYPDLRRIGIHLDIPKGLVVKEVDGAVEQAGMRPGDLITGIEGKPVLTFGDLQYHYNEVSRDAGQVRIEVNRDGAAEELTVDLPPEWWWTDLYHRYWSVEPILFFTSRPLSEADKRLYELEPGGFAVEVTGLYRDPRVRELNDVRPGDIIYAVDGVQVNQVTQNLETYIKLNKRAGDTFNVSLLRDGKAMESQIWTGRQRFRK